VRYIVQVGDREVEVVLAEDGVTVDGEPMSAHLTEEDRAPVRLLSIGNVLHRIAVRRGEGRGRYTLWVDGYRFETEALDERTRAIRALSAATAGAAGPSPLVAPMPGLVTKVLVAPGDQVQPGQGLVVMEAMKMENELRAPAGGSVKAVRVTPGTAVEKGAVLVELG
jgi:acetyl/propionyl-CoA carboxylase alpha subunit